MSHHTGAQLMALSFQTMLLINWMRHALPTQNMYCTLPMFHATRPRKRKPAIPFI